jgi:drug/metabolite transporter (DMT)-like permease
MRERPTLRIPLGILALLLGLVLYALAVMWASQWIERLPALAQALVYLVLGVIWLLPLRRFLIWMETGRWG